MFDEIKYPYEFNSIMIYEDHNECLTCGEQVGQGIIAISQHYCSCTGKTQFENVIKITDMPLRTEDKMDILKKEFNIEQ